MRALSIVLLLASRIAHANYDVERRDGCPAGNISTLPDVKHSSPSTVEHYMYTDPRRTGAIAQGDSALLPDQAGVDGSYGHFSNSDQGGPAYFASTTLHTHFHVNLFRLRHRLYSIGVTNMFARYWFEEDGLGDPWGKNGSAVIMPALRTHWTTTGTDLVDPLEVRAPYTSPQPVGLRHALALQAIVSVPTGTANDAADATRILRRFAFDNYLASPHPVFGGALETRSEGVGCYAPFIDLRLSLTASKTPDQVGSPTEHLAFFAPQTLAVGFAASSNVSVLVQYGLLLYYVTDVRDAMDHRPLLGTNAIHRFRFGGEYRTEHFTFGVHLDLFRGSTLYDGTVFGIALDGDVGD